MCSNLVRLTDFDGDGNKVGVSLASTKVLNKDELWVVEPVHSVLDQWVNQFLKI